MNQGIVRALLRSDPALLGQIMAAINNSLPFTAILVIDQGEEVFTLAQTPEDLNRGRQALDMLRRTVGAAGNFKVIFCLRTEYYGRVIDRLRRGLHDTGSIREYLLTDFDEQALIEAIRRPTADEAIRYTSDVPFERYGFRYADGVAEEIAHRVIRYTTQRRDSVLPLMQVICTQLHRLALQRDDCTIATSDLESLGGIEGGMRNHVEGLLGELLTERPSDKKPVQKLFTQLYLKQPDGTLTTALLPEDEVRKRWTGRMPFDGLLSSSRDMRLLKVNSLRIGMEEERRYVSLGHDALAKIAADWDEQLSRGARIRKLAGMLSAVACVALVMALLAVWGWVAQRRAQRNANDAIQARGQAEAKEAEARAVLEFVEEKMLAAVRPKGQEGGLGRDVKLRDVIDAALAHVDNSFADKPLVEAHLRMTLGKSFDFLSEHEKSFQQFQRAHGIRGEQLGSEHADTAESKDFLAIGHFKLGRRGEALKLFEDALRIRKKLLGPHHPDTFVSMNNLSLAYGAMGRRDEKLALLEETLALRKKHLGPEHAATLRTTWNVANLYFDMDRFNEAFKLHQEALAGRLATLGEEHPDTLLSRSSVGSLLELHGQHHEAATQFKAILDVQRIQLGPDHWSTLFNQKKLANAYCSLGRVDEAIAIQESVVESYRAEPSRLPSLQSAKVDLAASYVQNGRYDDAVKLADGVLNWLNSNEQSNEQSTTSALMWQLADVYRALERYDVALKLATTLIAVSREMQTLERLAGVYKASGRHDEAVKIYEELVELTTERQGPKHIWTLNNMSKLAGSYLAVKRHEVALELCKTAVTNLKSEAGVHHDFTLRGMVTMADCYTALDRHEDALKLHEKTLELRREHNGPQNRYTLACMSSVARAHAQLGRHAEALKQHRKTLALRKEHLGPHHSETIESIGQVAQCLIELQRDDEANSLLSDFLAEVPDKVPPSAVVELYKIRLRQYRKSNDVSGGRTLCQMWDRRTGDDVRSYYHAACLRNWLVATIRTSNDEDAAADAAVEAELAIQWLRKAIAAGYASPFHLAQNEDLSELRDCDDFTQLLADLEAGPRPPTK